MALWTWWFGDALPELPHISGLEIGVEQDVQVLTDLTRLDEEEIQGRLEAGHRAYVARLEGQPVAYGWVASLGASIGELELDFELPPGDRYLWDFLTRPEWRGRGIYPRLLQAIIDQERPEAQRFWIINAPENVASGAGIAKAGFSEIAELALRADGQLGSLPGEQTSRARVGAALLGIPLLKAAAKGRTVSPR